MFVRFGLQALVVGLVVAVAPSVVPSIQVAGPGVLIPSAVIVGLVNAGVRPMLRFARHPVTVSWIALMTTAVNALAVILGPSLTMGWTFSGVGTAIGTVLALSFVSTATGTVPLQRGDRRLRWGLHEGDRRGEDATEARPLIRDEPTDASTAH